MLKIAKSINFNGTSSVKDAEGNDVSAAAMSANISDDGSININTYIQNKELYEANKPQVREDISEFDDYVYTYEA